MHAFHVQMLRSYHFQTMRGTSDFFRKITATGGRKGSVARPEHEGTVLIVTRAFSGSVEVPFRVLFSEHPRSREIRPICLKAEVSMKKEKIHVSVVINSTTANHDSVAM